MKTQNLVKQGTTIIGEKYDHQFKILTARIYAVQGSAKVVTKESK